MRGSTRSPILSLALAVALAGALVACASTDRPAGDEAEVGVVRGVVLVGPTCPVEVQGSPCPDRPFHGIVRVVDAAGDVAAVPETDADGGFAIELEPGTYTLTPVAPGDRFPTSEPETVGVDAGASTEVTLRVDSGIR